MSKANDPVSKLFNVRDARVMVFGGTIIDTDDAAGYSETTMNRSAKPLEWTAKNALTIYPRMQLVQEEEKDTVFGMSAVWNNGFVPVKKGLLEAANMTKRSSNFLNNCGYVTTDQIFKTRQEEKFNALFASMKWYSSDPKKKNVNLIDPSLVQADGKKTVIDLGMTCEKWFSDPVSIRYMFRNESAESSDAPDYIYLIGGSRELLANDLSPVCAEIAKLYKSAREAFETDSKKKADPEALKLSNIQSKNGIWLAYDQAKSEQGLNDNQMKQITAMRNRRRMVRLIQGIFYIRNYLMYSKKLEMDTVLDFDASSSTLCTKVPVKDVLAKYEEAYQYCKNLVGVFPDIATCSWA